MKVFSLAFLMLFFAYTVSAQVKTDYEVSAPYKVIDAAKKYYLSTSEGHILTVKNHGDNTWLQLLDTKTMKEVKREEYKKTFPSGFDIEYVTWIKDRAFLLYSLWDKKNTTEQLFCVEIDVENLKFIGEPRRIIAVEGKVTGMGIGVGIGFWSFGVTDKFDLHTSLNDDRILIQYRKKPEKKRDAINHDVIGMYIFDENMEQISGNEIEMPYTEKQMDNLDYAIDSEGNTYTLARVRPDGSASNQKGKEVNYHIELLTVPAGSKAITKTKVDLKDNFIQSIALFEKNNNEMVCAGYYNKDNGAGADGLFMFDLEKDGSYTEANYYEIPVEILNQYVRKAEAKRNEKKDAKGKAEFEALTLDKLVVQEDGSIVLMGEQYFVTVYYDSKGRAQYTYHYYDMLVTKVNADGTLAWMRKLPKRQKGKRGQGEMSYRHMSYDGNHYFVFVDNDKNIDLKLEQRPAVHADGLGGFLMMYHVDDETGNVSKAMILDKMAMKNDHRMYQLDMRRILMVSENEFAVEYYKKGKEDAFIKVKVMN